MRLKPHYCLSVASLLGCLLALSVQASESQKPGHVFKDCKNCPELVVLPAGSFQMG